MNSNEEFYDEDFWYEIQKCDRFLHQLLEKLSPKFIEEWEPIIKKLYRAGHMIRTARLNDYYKLMRKKGHKTISNEEIEEYGRQGKCTAVKTPLGNWKIVIDTKNRDINDKGDE